MGLTTRVVTRRGGSQRLSHRIPPWGFKRKKIQRSVTAMTTRAPCETLNDRISSFGIVGTLSTSLGLTKGISSLTRPHGSSEDPGQLLDLPQALWFLDLVLVTFTVTLFVGLLFPLVYLTQDGPLRCFYFLYPYTNLYFPPPNDSSLTHEHRDSDLCRTSTRGHPYVFRHSVKSNLR